MAFSVSNTGSIVEDFNNTLNEAFGGSNGGNPNKKPQGLGGGVSGIGPQATAPAFGASTFESSYWSGNAYKVGRGKLKYKKVIAVNMSIFD